jgi:hypothetical protein
MADAIVLSTSDQITRFRLASLRYALRLEVSGMHRHGRSALSIVRAMTGLKARTAKTMLPLFEKWVTEKYGYEFIPFIK